MLTVPTQSELASYGEFIDSQLKPIIVTAVQEMPSMLYHYTSGDSLIKIIKSGTLWATQVSCVNDQTELHYGQSLLINAIREIRPLIS